MGHSVHLLVYLGGAQSCRVQSSSVPTYVLFLQVTFTTSMPKDTAGQNTQVSKYYRVKTGQIILLFPSAFMAPWLILPEHVTHLTRVFPLFLSAFFFSLPLLSFSFILSFSPQVSSTQAWGRLSTLHSNRSNRGFQGQRSHGCLFYFHSGGS